MENEKYAQINVNSFLSEVSEMDADCVGWYTKLVLHMFEKGSLPNNLEKLAILCGVGHSNFVRFQRVYAKYIREKFKVDQEHRLVHISFSKVVTTKKRYVNKRVVAGKKSYMTKFLRREYDMDDDLVNYIKKRIDYKLLDLKNEEDLKERVNRLLKEKNIILLKSKGIEGWKYRKNKKISRIEDLEFRNRVLNFFEQTTPLLKSRANGYMNQLENYSEFYQQTIAYMNYKDFNGGGVMTWRRYKATWRKKNWFEKYINICSVG